MKLLVSWMRELSSYISREFYYIMQDLIQVYGWRQIEPTALSQYMASPKGQLLEVLGEIPEVVLFWETYDLFNAILPALRDLGCGAVLFADDLHMLWGQESRRNTKLLAFSHCDLLLTPYAYVFGEFYPELQGRKKVVWVPHSASPDFVLPFNAQPENAILLSGFIGSLYPLRLRMKELQQENRYAIVQHQHPGYSTVYDYEKDMRIGVGYARTINRFKAGFTDALTFRYVVAKHFEIPATGALLIADGSVDGPLRQLGFIENIHYIPVCAEDLEEKIGYILDTANNAEIDAIRRRGQELVLSAHRTCDRAELINSACSWQDSGLHFTYKQGL
ncbi:MAG: glycosyltransferase family 1 protein [Acidobacteriaceae bacterium]|nr:glycosyltransferase family 1 protein [Acidobacteriaceae bacterium]